MVRCGSKNRHQKDIMCSRLVNYSRFNEVCGCYSVHFSCSSASTDWIYTMKHQHKSHSKLDLPSFSYGYQKCMLVDF